MEFGTGCLLGSPVTLSPPTSPAHTFHCAPAARYLWTFDFGSSLQAEFLYAISAPNQPSVMSSLFQQPRVRKAGYWYFLLFLLLQLLG